MIRFVLIILLVGYSGMVHGLMKRWIPDTNFDNPNNWNTGRVPCKNDRVRLPVQTGTVYVQTNQSFEEIVLPINGELVLGNYMSLSFQDSAQSSTDSDCSGQEVSYNGTKAYSWFDPENWCQVADPEGGCLSEPEPCMDVECLPCQTDHVIFPAGAGFLVDMDSGVDIYIGKLSIRGKELSTGQFKSYTRSGHGKEEFQFTTGNGVTNVNIQGELCQDPAGCPCGNDRGNIEKKICDIQAPRCDTPSCLAPLLPQGSCCHICGAVMIIDTGEGFNYERVTNMLYNIIPRAQRQSVRVMISRLHTQQIQVVIQDTDGTNQVTVVVSAFQKGLKPDESGNYRYNILNVNVISSDSDEAGNPINPQHQRGKGGKMMSPGSIASLVLAILAVLAIVLIAMYCLIDRRRPGITSRLHLPAVSWPFRRFSHGDDRRAMELGPSVGFKDNISAYAGSTRSFSNPAYDTNISGPLDDNANADHPNAAVISTIDVSQPTFVTSAQNTAFSNPMYGDEIKENVPHMATSVKIDPIFSTDGIEHDSMI